MVGDASVLVVFLRWSVGTMGKSTGNLNSGGHLRLKPHLQYYNRGAL